MCMKRLYTAIWSVALILMMTSCAPATPAITESGTAFPTGAEPDRLSSAEPVTLTLSSTLQHTNADSAYPAWAEDAGLDAMESAMTARFADALERYHAAGYFTDIQP